MGVNVFQLTITEAKALARKPKVEVKKSSTPLPLYDENGEVCF